MEVVGVGLELMDLVMHFESCGSLRAPVPGLLIYLSIWIELGHEVLDITLILDVQKAILEVLSEVQIFVAVSFA